MSAPIAAAGRHSPRVPSLWCGLNDLVQCLVSRKAVGRTLGVVRPALAEADFEQLDVLLGRRVAVTRRRQHRVVNPLEKRTPSRAAHGPRQRRTQCPGCRICAPRRRRSMLPAAQERVREGRCRPAVPLQARPRTIRSSRNWWSMHSRVAVPTTARAAGRCYAATAIGGPRRPAQRAGNVIPASRPPARGRA